MDLEHLKGRAASNRLNFNKGHDGRGNTIRIKLASRGRMYNYGSAYANELVGHITVPCKRTNEFMHLQHMEERNPMKRRKERFKLNE